VLTFAPKGMWKKGDYRLVVDSHLEDVCGNQIGKPFEVEVIDPAAATPELKVYERSFKVR
jgi:hypothetical protein